MSVGSGVLCIELAGLNTANMSIYKYIQSFTSSPASKQIKIAHWFTDMSGFLKREIWVAGW